MTKVCNTLCKDVDWNSSLFARPEDRNFRSHYYEKVGFRGMDERKTLDLILKDDPISLEKCVNFALRCTIPTSDRYMRWNFRYYSPWKIRALMVLGSWFSRIIYKWKCKKDISQAPNLSKSPESIICYYFTFWFIRQFVWKLLLGEEATYPNNRKDFNRWKERTYRDCKRLLKSSARIDDSWTLDKTLTIMWLLFDANLNLDFNSQVIFKRNNVIYWVVWAFFVFNFHAILQYVIVVKLSYEHYLEILWNYSWTSGTVRTSML